MVIEWGAHPLLLYTLVILLGLLFGSFLNVVIYRLPIMLRTQWRQECQTFLHPDHPTPSLPIFNLMQPASHCPSCQRPVAFYDNVPILSYLLLKGRCRGCQTHIPLRYPFIEALTALCFCAVVFCFGVSIQSGAYLLLTLSLLSLSVIDIDHTILPDEIVLPTLWAGLLWSTLLGTTPQAILGATLGYLSLWLVYWVFKIVTGKEGMGYGDFKLLSLLGAWLGWQSLPIILLLSASVGSVVGLTLIARGRLTRNTPMPFGPFIAGAGFITLLFSPQLQSFFYGIPT